MIRPSSFTGALLFFLCLFTAQAATPVQTHGALRVNGNRIVDRNGSSVQLRGMSLFWSQWIGKYWNSSVINWLADDWKCTIVRAPMAVESGGYLTNPDAEKQKVKTVVDAAIAKGIYVIIDWHDHNASSHTDQAKAFFQEMARTYGNQPNVIYEIFNEPDTETWPGQIKPYAQTVIAAIRQHDPDNLVIVGTPNWSQYVDIAAQDPISDPAVAYTLHFYAATHKESLRQRARTALSKGVALFVTEWGTCESNGSGTLDRTETATWISFMDQNKLSWCNWSIADKAETSAALLAGASTSGGWAESNLSESGKLLRTTLRSYGSTGATVPSGKNRRSQLNYTSPPSILARADGRGVGAGSAFSSSPRSSNLSQGVWFAFTDGVSARSPTQSTLQLTIVRPPSGSNRSP